VHFNRYRFGGHSNSRRRSLRVGADTLIRTGTTGALWKDIDIGDLIISLGAYRADGATIAYAPIAYPAIANYEVVSALVEAAETVGARYWLWDHLFYRLAFILDRVGQVLRLYK